MTEVDPTTSEAAQAAASFQLAAQAVQRGDGAALRAHLEDAARAGHAGAARRRTAIALHEGGLAAARAFLAGLSASSGAAAALFLEGELARFHDAADPDLPRATAWALPLARAALAGHPMARWIVDLHRIWSPGAAVPFLPAPGSPETVLPADDAAVRTLAGALIEAEAQWAPPVAEVLVERDGVRVERVRAFAPEPLVQGVRALLAPHLQAAMVVDPRTGARRRHPVRDNAQAQWLPELRGWLGKLLDARLAQAGAYAVVCGEVTNLLRYGPGEAYRPHLDCLPPARTGVDAGTRDEGGQRMLTQLLGLGDDDYTGGETRFTELDLAVRLHAGDLLTFTNADARGMPLPASRHEGCALETGEKWLLSKWVRARPTPYG
ncbi:MAG TPA: 2OG-Fe(II) oxygenase, partial [Pseudomonadales bacterium]|nr:2OG-Fe(II) oxygenase [Pseudomonadales bacterium]